jgi:hypothetical protein
MLCRQVGGSVGKTGFRSQHNGEAWGRGNGQFKVQPPWLVFLIEPSPRLGTVDLIAPELVSGVPALLHYSKSPGKA